MGFYEGFEKRATMKNMRSGLEAHEKGSTLNTPEPVRPGIFIQPKTTPLPLPTYSKQNPKSNLKTKLPSKEVDK
jgi:hypothetical protein